MAKNWHKVVVNGFARYRASGSRRYVSYNVEKDSWSSKMLPGNMPVEQLERAPKNVKVRGEAWGVKVERSYLEGELPVVAVIAYRGREARFNWERARAAGYDNVVMGSPRYNEFVDAADPAHVSLANYSHRSMERAEEALQSARAYIKEGTYCGYNAAMIVELR